jgi:hypothetical protein
MSPFTLMIEPTVSHSANTVYFDTTWQPARIIPTRWLLRETRKFIYKLCFRLYVGHGVVIGC